MSGILENAFAILRDNACAIPATLADAMSQLENPLYRIAVIGKFQVGKSTLINRVFLGSDSLPTEGGAAGAVDQSTTIDELDAFLNSSGPALIEGDGLCTTSVATEVGYGEQPTLEVYPWKVRADTVDTLDGEKPVAIREEPGTPDITVHPTPENLRSATTAGSSDARLAKAQSTALVRLLWPEPALERYTLIDTPGIDDPIPEIINTTTYRVLPGADTAILVLEPRSLDQVELDFLRRRVFEAGLVRILALVSYNPEAKKLGAGARNDILSAIRAQLKNIGRDSIPVEMYCFDPSVEGDILNTPVLIRARLLEYLDQNVGASRRGKTAHLLRAALRDGILRLRTAEAALRKSEAERREIAQKIEAKAQECNAEFESLIDEVLDDLNDFGYSAKRKLRDEMSVALQKRAKELDSCQNIAEVQQMIRDMNTGLQRDVEKSFFDISVDLKKSLKSLSAKYGDRMKRISAPVHDTLTVELQLNGGLLAKVPSILVTLVDVLAPIIILPTPFFVDLILRHFAMKSETLRQLLPANIALNLLVGQVRNKLIGQQDGIMAMVDGKLDEVFEDAKAKTRAAIEQARREEMAAIRAGLDVNAGADAAVEARRIAKAKTELEQALRGVESN